MNSAIMQPTYMPWIGYFSLIDEVDTFVFLNNVQLEKRSWQVRNKILLQGKEFYLTIPISDSKSRDDRLISNTMVDTTKNWKNQHLQTIKQAYAKSPYYKEIYAFFNDEYEKTDLYIGGFTQRLIVSICRQIGITTPFVSSSELDLNPLFKKDYLLVAICQKIGADTYISARGSSAYIEANNPGGEFSNNNISLHYQEYNHPQYPQLVSDFIPFIGIYDLLFNVGFENALAVIRSGQS